MRRLIFILIISVSSVANAISLAKIAEPKEERLPINRQEPNIECNKIIDRLEKYNEMARQHDQGMTGFLGEVVQKMNDWYLSLQPLEGAKGQIESGTFSVLEDGAAKISLVTDRAFENSDLLANELDRIIVSLRACTQKKR